MDLVRYNGTTWAQVMAVTAFHPTNGNIASTYCDQSE
jgi:hypothetical protein